MSELDSKIKKLIESDADQLICVGAPWCAPCKALKPLLVAEMARIRDEVSLQFSEIEIREEEELSGSQYVRSLPTVIRSSAGEISVLVAGLMTADQIRAIISERPDVCHTEMRYRQAASAGDMAQAFALYARMPEEIRFSSENQRLKSLMDLRRSAAEALREVLNDPIRSDALMEEILSLLRDGHVEEALEQLISDHRLFSEWEGFALHAVNTLPPGRRSGYLRRKFRKAQDELALALS